MTTSNRVSLEQNPNGAKWDRCLTDSIVKTVSGLALGLVFSGILFKRRAWPVFLGTGIGIGMGYSNCQNDLRSSSLPITPSDS